MRYTDQISLEGSFLAYVISISGKCFTSALQNSSHASSHLPSQDKCYFPDKQFGCLPTPKALCISPYGNPFPFQTRLSSPVQNGFCTLLPYLKLPSPIFSRGPILLARRWNKPFLTCHNHPLPHPCWITISPVSLLPRLWSCSCLHLEFPLRYSPSPQVTSKEEEHQFIHKAKLKYCLSKSMIVTIYLSEESNKKKAQNFSTCQ